MRGRLAKPIDGLDQYDFDKLAKSPEFSARERLRFLAIAHIKDGARFVDVAKMIRIDSRSISVWANKFRKKGIDGLRDQYCGGAQLKLPADKYKEFQQAVVELQTNRKGGRIRGEDVRILLKTKYGIQCSLATVYNTLKRAKLVWITGRSQHPKGNEKAQQSFKKTLKRKSSKQFQAVSI